MDNSTLIALINAFIEKRFDNLQIDNMRGPRGLRGKSGHDFDFEENKEDIFQSINNALDEIKDDLKLKFSDLSNEEKNSLKLTLDSLDEKEISLLRGGRGQKGRQGKSFDYEENREKINQDINLAIDSVKDSLKLKFKELSDDEKLELQGSIGPRGVRGKGFNYEENKDQIQDDLSVLIQSIKEDLKLRFKDLTEEDKLSLRGPKGLRGKSGKDFIYEDHKDEFLSILSNLFDAEKDDLKIRFSDLNEKEKHLLKLKFNDLTDDERYSLRGEKGGRGQRGRSIRGEKGSVWLAGEVNPTIEASCGDMYLNTLTGDIFIWE